MSGPINREEFNREVRELLEKEFNKAYDSYMEAIIANNLQEIERLMRDNRIPSNDVLRIAVNEDGTINIYDFGFVGVSKRKLENLAQQDVPPWIMETISMLRIADDNDLVPELGFKVTDHLYYVIDRTGESHE